MLAAQATARLNQELAAAIGSIGLADLKFGLPELVKKRKDEAERLFQGYATAKPNKEDAYAAARAFVLGHPLDSWQHDLVASALSEPIIEASNAVAFSSKRILSLLAAYENEARQGELWRLTWHGLLSSYFAFNLTDIKDEDAKSGWQALRGLLQRTWPLMERQAGNQHVPEWVAVLRREAAVLTDKPTDQYADSYLRGDTTSVEQLASDLGIPSASWFWHSLVLDTVRRATEDSDEEFRRNIPRLIQLIQSKPAFRDEAIEQILVRYHACQGAPQNEQLRDFVVQRTVWKNPKLKLSGIATAWNRVPDQVWNMVLGWVNERNLKDFFDILAARNKADEGRLAFWSKYMKQITWTRLVFGADTMMLKNRNAEIRDLIAREEGAYAELTSKRDVDAFMMQIGPYVIIEFSKAPNACYVYKASTLPFNRYDRYYNGGTADLASGYVSESRREARIIHTPGWEARSAVHLRHLGIHPDQANTSHVPNTPHIPQFVPNVQTDVQVAQSGKGPNMAELQLLLQHFHGSRINDKRRDANGGRLWVEDPSQNARLASELKSRGFRWADKRGAWYYPES